jgi:xylan 1,4-beta-xylosidase
VALHDDDVGGPAAQVGLAINGLAPRSRTATISHYRVDETHSNSYAAWRRLGSPIVLNEDQYALVEKAGKLILMNAAREVEVRRGAATLSFLLPRQGVSLVVLDVTGAATN